jgi:radical SAM superfamily enzyme YgiQ (UPF0313 family)
VNITWLDVGDPGAFVRAAGPLERWQDHGLGLLRTIQHQAGVRTDLASVRAFRSWRRLGRRLAGADLLLMNVRSYTFPVARRAAQVFKAVNPRGRVIVGGLHASVALDEMLAVPEFDHICRGGGERAILSLGADLRASPRVVDGAPAKSMADWPAIDRTLWPNPGRGDYPWPLEPACGWGPAPVATILTGRVCPWRCAFCNEASYIPTMDRRPVDAVIDELNAVDRAHGPVGSVVIHDSMFFQQPRWLRAWLDAYPRRARRVWPYWAAGRADTVRQWPDLFEALVCEAGWRTVSIGFESGSDRVLKILNKECSVADNEFTIDLLNRIGDDCVKRGQEPPRFWANIMLGTPGETREDAFATMRMVRRMRYVIPSFSLYAPYPGSALGYQLAAEGQSLMTSDNYHRYPHDEKVRGVDYRFYRRLLRGRHDAEIDRGLLPSERAAAENARPAGNSFSGASNFYLFDLPGGRRKLAYGTDPHDAIRTLAARQGGAAPAAVDPTRCSRIHQRDLHAHRERLG